jgi:hypothetical protein
MGLDHRLGGLTGIVGQGIRIVVGLKKAADGAAARGQKFTETIEPARLVISSLAGALPRHGRGYNLEPWGSDLADGAYGLGSGGLFRR